MNDWILSQMKKNLILLFISMFILLSALQASYALENSYKADIKKKENQNIKLEISTPEIKLIHNLDKETERRKVKAEEKTAQGNIIKAWGSVISTILLILGGIGAIYKYFKDREDAELNKKNQQFIELLNRASSTNHLEKSNAISSLPLLIGHNKIKYKKTYVNLDEYLKCYHKQNPYIRETISIIFNALLHQEKNIEESVITIACSESLSEITRKSLNNNVTVKTKSDDTRQLVSAICFDDKKLIKTKFHKIDLTGSSLRGIEILQSELTNSKLNYTDLSYASFIGSNFCRSDIQNAILKNSNFNSSDLSYCKLSGSNLRLCDFTSANLYQADFSGCTNILDADFTDCIIDKKNYDFIRDKGVKYYSFYEFKASNAPEAEFIYTLFPDLQNKDNVGLLQNENENYKSLYEEAKIKDEETAENPLVQKKWSIFGFDIQITNPLYDRLGGRNE